jgi:peptidoglycan/xylan/chitin deacetylase (PgdA/CDA1 family)
MHQTIRFPIFLTLLLTLASCIGDGKSAKSGLARIAAPATLTIARKQYEQAYFDIPTDRNWVALTIDDSPNGTSTQKILDLLNASPGNPHATFFIIGEHGAENLESLQAITASNHELANHGFTTAPTSNMGLTEFIVNVEKTHAVLSNLWDESDMKWFRPSDGSFNDQQAGYLQRERGYEIALGNAYPFDYRDNNIPAAISHIKRFVRPGAIIILHDGPEQGERTVRILEQVLPWLEEEGYSVKTLSELFESKR